MTEMTRSDINTVSYNPYFPNQQQTKHCWVSFVDFKRCEKKLGAEAPECEKYFRAYNSLCPDDWVDKWETQIENGTFAGASLISK